MILGTIAYMSPEHVRGLPVDHRADIFAFGCILYEMVSGRRPFSGESAIETMHAIAKNEAPELPVGVRESAPGIVRLIATCLAKQPRERWQSAADLARELSWLGGTGAARCPSGRAPAPPRDWLPWMLAILGIAVAIIAFLPRKPPVDRNASSDFRCSHRRRRGPNDDAGGYVAGVQPGRPLHRTAGILGRPTALWLWSVAEGAASRLADTEAPRPCSGPPTGVSSRFSRKAS